MHAKPHAKPIKRSDMRLYFGKKYFTLKRYMQWLFSKHTFAKKRLKKKHEKKHENTLPHQYAAHQTPLYRQLKDVEMHLQQGKVANLRIAVPRLHHVTLRPGQVFSYWRLIGKPTKRKGYQKGMVLKSGTVTASTGGGLCQLSNLIYWLTIHTPLTVIERHRHGYDVFPDVNRTQPFGSGATCFYNYGDLMIQNNTDSTFQLALEITDEHLKGAWLCDRPPAFTYEVYEKEHVMRSQFWGGHTRHNLIYRKKYDMEGNFLDDEYVVENHAIMMYAPFLTAEEVNQ